MLLEFAGRAETHEKGRNDLVTEADLQSQQAISAFIRRSVSADATIIGEEGPRTGIDPTTYQDLVWLVDPLDGTTNYVHGFPHFCVSVAAVRNQQVLAAAVFDPGKDECFSAGSGDGASLNGNPIHASQTTLLARALVAASLPAAMDRSHPEVERFLRACESTRSVRRTGSAALNLSYVACGRLDAYWATTVQPWDAAAGVLLVQEAGGHVSDLNGGPFHIFRPQVLTAATGQLSRALQQILQVA